MRAAAATDVPRALLEQARAVFDAPIRVAMSTTVSTSVDVSVPTIIAPSPNHFAIRTPRVDATSRTVPRKPCRISTARSSPSLSV